MKQTLICSPGKKYNGASEKEVAKDYFKLGKDYHKLIRFDECCEKMRWVSDVDAPVAEIRGRTIAVRAYVRRDVVGVADLNGSFTFSEYLFGPRSFLVGLLPDLDVFEISGENSNIAVQKISDFYKAKGWNAHTQIDELKRRKEFVVQNLRSDLGDRVLIPSYDSIKEIAIANLGYEPNRWAFE